MGENSKNWKSASKVQTIKSYSFRGTSKEVILTSLRPDAIIPVKELLVAELILLLAAK